MVDEESQNAASEPARGAPVNRDRPHDPGVIEAELASASAQEEPQAGAGSDRAPARRPARGFLGSLLSGALGGLLAAVIAVAAVYLVFLPKADLVEANAGRLAALEAEADRAGGGAQRQAAAVAGIEKRVGALEASQPGRALAELDKRVGALDNRLGAVERTAGTEAAKVSAASETAERSANATKDIKAEVDAALARLPALEARLAKLESAAEAPKAGSPDLSDLETRIRTLESALAALKAETRVASEKASSTDNPAAVTLVAGALRDRLAAGAPFPTELAALQNLGVDPAKLAPLKALAGGAPTDRALAASFEAVAPKALAAAASPREPSDAWDRFLAHIHGLVQVRDLAETTGDDPAALVSQIEAETRRGDLHAALAAFAKLPEPARRAAADWAAAAGARQQADDAVQSIREAALENLAAGKS
ncbi:MAG: hypothetical protein JO288_08365 [Hyphomicrobiales bacterium]|nr:hypothetical protein [Hyphomicrobiales bacterium]